MSWSVAKLKEIAAARGEDVPRDSQLDRALAAEAQLRHGGEHARRSREALDEALKGIVNLPDPHKAEHAGITRLRAEVKGQEPEKQQVEDQAADQNPRPEQTVAETIAAQDSKPEHDSRQRPSFEVDVTRYTAEDEDELDQSEGQSMA